MSERYIKVFSVNENLYIENAPVVICAGALLKDTKTGRMIAQLKFQNFSGKSISYVKVAVTQLDSVKKPLGEAIDFEYLDISVADRVEFGSKKPLICPNASTRSFDVGVICVGFADGTTWTSDNTDWQSAPESSDIIERIAAERTYKIALALSKKENREDVQKAKDLFESIAALKEVDIELETCKKRFAEFDAEELRKENLKKNAWKIVLAAVGACILIALIGYFVVYPFSSISSGEYDIYVKMYQVKHFDVPNDVSVIDQFAFTGCQSLESVSLPRDLEAICYGAFDGCGDLESIEMPEYLYSIGPYAFQWCYNLSSVTFEGLNLRVIERGAFRACESLESFVVPKGVEQIGGCAFMECINLETVTIPKSVKKIGESVFNSCEKLTTIIYEGTMQEWEAIGLYRDIDNESPYYYDWDSYYGFEGDHDYDDWDCGMGSYTVYCTDGTIRK